MPSQGESTDLPPITINKGGATSHTQSGSMHPSNTTATPPLVIFAHHRMREISMVAGFRDASCWLWCCSLLYLFGLDGGRRWIARERPKVQSLINSVLREADSAGGSGGG
nr:hypothetical protein Itr_chr09CG06180 [Ipomoea trifida]